MKPAIIIFHVIMDHIFGINQSMKDPLKKLIQGKKGLGLEGLLKSIRAYAKVKNSEEVMDEMKAYCQQPKQSEIDYLTAMCTFRDNILAMTIISTNHAVDSWCGMLIPMQLTLMTLFGLWLFCVG